jgi:hypothetical protein
MLLKYAVANPLQKRGKAGAKKARLRDFILFPVLNEILMLNSLVSEARRRG